MVFFEDNLWICQEMHDVIALATVLNMVRMLQSPIKFQLKAVKKKENKNYLFEQKL